MHITITAEDDGGYGPFRQALLSLGYKQIGEHFYIKDISSSVFFELGGTEPGPIMLQYHGCDPNQELSPENLPDKGKTLEAALEHINPVEVLDELGRKVNMDLFK